MNLIRAVWIALALTIVFTTTTFAMVLWEVSVMAEQVTLILEDIGYLKRNEVPVSTNIRVVDPGDPEACLTITVTADPGTPEEEAANLKAKVIAAYKEFGRWEE